jgi:hypothetical protein
MDLAKRKGLKNAYKDIQAVGGIYCIECDGNHRRWVKATSNLAGQKNKYTFAISTNSCPEPAMRAEWNQYGVKSFSFTVLEELKKKETQSDHEFSADIDILLEMWLEKYNQDGQLHGTEN